MKEGSEYRRDQEGGGIRMEEGSGWSRDQGGEGITGWRRIRVEKGSGRRV